MASLQSPPQREAISPEGSRGSGVWTVRHHVLVLAIALALWISSLYQINLASLTDIGLVSVLPATFYVAIGLLAIGFSVAFTSLPRPWLLEIYVVALVVFLHAIVPILYAVPKYAYVYKHIAVIRFIEQFGSTYRNIDIYQNWPGFFAGNAILSKVTGIDAASYANIALPFFMVCNILAVRFLARGLTDDRRRVAATMWIFVLGSWLAPAYLAPQTMAYVMTLTTLGIVVRYLPGLRASERQVNWFPGRGSSIHEPRPVELQGAWPRVAAASVVLALSAAIVVSHQLTPFFLIVSLVIIKLARRGGSWWLPILITIITMAQIAASYHYIAAHQVLFSFNPFGNLQGAQRRYPTAGSEEHVFISQVARGLSLAFLVFALLAWWRIGRRRGETWILLLAFAPGLLVLVQAYGGEGIYRIYAFMCFWLSFLASGLLVRLNKTNRWKPHVLSVGSFIAIIALIISYFGLDRADFIPPQEVAASRWFENSTPSGSIITYLSSDYPSPTTARYSEHFTGDGNWGGEVMSNDRFAGRALTERDIPDVAKSLLDIARPGQQVYLALGPSSEAYAEGYGFAPAGSLQRFGDILVKDNRFRVVFRDQDAYILQVLRPPSGP